MSRNYMGLSYDVGNEMNKINTKFENSIYDMDFISIGISEIDPNRFNNIKNSYFKPDGGLWASKYNIDTISDWYQFLINDSGLKRNTKVGIKFNIKQESKVYIVDDIYDYRAFVDMGIISSDSGSMNIINYELISSIYDGVYFSDGAIIEMGFGFYYGSDRRYNGVDMSLYGYDVDSLILFNLDCICNEEVIKIENTN